MKALIACLLLSLSAAVLAQDEMPAVGGKKPAAPAPPETKQPGVGTTILGERESPIGLYITPWRNATAEQNIDRPARLLQEQMLPIDEDVFNRQIEYYDALTTHLKEQGQVTPAH